MEQQPLLKDGEKKSLLPTRNLFLAVCAVGIGGSFLIGYNISIINVPTTHIQKFINETWEDHYSTELNKNTLTFIWSVIVSIFTAGGVVGACVGGSLATKLGRKSTLLVNNLFTLIASLFMGIAHPTGRFEFLIVGRFLVGINAGIALCVQPLYLGEIAPKHLRGAMALGTAVCLTGGLFIGQIVGLRELLGEERYWPILMSTSCIPAIAQLLTLPWFPESPRYLMIDRSEEIKCIKALKTFHGPLNYQSEMEDIKKENVLIGEKPKKIGDLFTDGTLTWQLITVIVINAAQQLCGINAIFSYAHYIFKQAGFPEQNIPYVTLGTGAFECIAASVCGILIDRVGRRILIIGGYALIAFWCIILTVTLTFQEASPWVPYLSMASIFAFVISFGLGPGGVTSTLSTELFTQSARAAALTMGSIVNWTSLFIIGFLFPFMVNVMDHYCFLVFLVVSLSIAAFIFFVVPETKNKSFLEIKENFQHLNRSDKIPASEQNEESMFETDI